MCTCMCASKPEGRTVHDYFGRRPRPRNRSVVRAVTPEQNRVLLPAATCTWSSQSPGLT